MDILISFAAKIVEYTVAPIGRQVGYLIYYKNNFEELKDQVEELQGAKERINHEIEAEKRNGKEIEADVRNWLNKVDEITIAANKLSEDPHRVNMGCSKWSFPDLKSRHQLSRNAKKMARNVAQVHAKGKFDRIGYQPPLDVVSMASTTRGNEKLVSRNRMKEDIVLALKDPTVSKIGVYGLSGVGKTTIVKEVAKQVKDDKLFDAVVMADVTQTLDLNRIQNEIAEQLGLQLQEKTSLVRASRLRERIRKEQTILIILDDIWKNFDLEKIGIPLDGAEVQGKGKFECINHEGCKILLISRKQDTLQNMETQKNFRLEVLNGEETWSLFEVMVGDAIKDANLHSIANQVAAKSGGLPVLIVTVARALKNKDIYCWKDALNQLQTFGDGGLNEIVYSSLEFSYKQLESNEVKSLFLLCGIIGHYPISYLLKCGIGLGIFKHVSTVEDARNKLHRMIGDLKASCLLLEDDTRVRMHEIVCEVATAIASRDQYVFTLKWNAQLKDWPTEDFLKRCTQIILDSSCIQILPEWLDCPNLKLFHIYGSDNRSLKIPDSFFEGMKNLGVLDLLGMTIPSLPTSFVFLTKLQTLCLDECVLGDMTGIGSLKNLKILSFLESSMMELPSEIGQLIHLRMLDLSSTGFKIVPSNVISNLVELEELYMGNTSIKWELQNSVMENGNASLAELKHLKNLTTLEIQILEAWMLPRTIMFEKLERYKIVIGDIWEWSDENEAPRLLKLKLKTSIHLEHGIKMLIKKVEDLYLDEINGVSDVLYHLNGEGFPLLKKLHIQNNAKLQHIVSSSERNRTHVFFPKLETLVLHNLANLEKVCHDSLTSNSFGKLKVIKVKHCGQLEYLFSFSMVKELSQLIEIEVSECNSMKNIVSMESTDSGKTTDKIEFIQLYSLTLQHLPMIDNFYSSDYISSTIEIKSESLSTNIQSQISFFNVKVACPNLETLKLSAINLRKIWDNDQLCLIYSFQNLVNLIVEDCGNLKYLFSSSMIEGFKNLKWLEINKCDMMEEIVATKERNDDDPSEEVRFSKLEKIVINDLKNLKTVWHYQFQGLKTLEANKCEKLENIFRSCYTQKAFKSLERLKVSDCAIVEEIFKMNANTLKCQHREEDTTELRTLILVKLPKLKQIWSKDPQATVCFYNLQTMQITYCHSLEYLFPFSIAKDLSNLESLQVISCDGIKEIVSKMDGAIERTVLFELNHLASLDLQHLIQLRGFYAGAHTLQCQSLKTINVFNCKQLKLFDVESNRSQEMALIDQLHFPTLQPLFTVEEVIGNLEQLTLNYAEANMILQHQVPWDLFCKLKLLRISLFEDVEAAFPHLFLQNVLNLEILVVEWSSFKEIFNDETVGGEGGGNQSSTQLKEMNLYDLPILQHIFKEGSQIHPVLQVLEILTVKQCSNLRNLAPSSIRFCHLMHLEIENCNGFINLITSLTAKSLVKLETIKLKKCNSLEEIVIEGEEDTKSEIVFSSLKILELECLPSLNCFSSCKCFMKFPLLEKVVVMECPRMEIFSINEASSPMLRKVLFEEKDEQWRWEGDLSRTINKMFIDKVAFHSFKHLELSEYPELKELWYRPIGHRPFCNLKSLVVQECDWLSNVLLPLNRIQALFNLEELEVRNCESLEAVFDLGDMNESKVVVKETIQLKKIIVENLANLKHIWKQDTQEIVSFDNSRAEHIGDDHKRLKTLEASSVDIQPKDPPTLVEKTRNGVPKKKVGFHNLQVLIVEHCKALECLFPFHIAVDLLYLEKIKVDSCGIKEIVANKEEPTGAATFVFKHLFSLELINLEKLEKFYARNYSLACPTLKIINVFSCNKLELFTTHFMNSQERGVMGDGNSIAIRQSREQPLFTAEEVIPNLEELTLDIKVVNMILQGQYSGELFTKLKLLRVSKFEDEQITFPDWFLENASYLESLIVEWSSFKQVFQDDRLASNQGNNNVHTRLKKLTLFELPKLQHICKEGSQIDPILDFLEILFVFHCSNLKHLVPSSARFGHLTYLKIQKCNGLTHLITSPTTRNLVNLKTMMIIECSSLEQIVMQEGDDQIRDEIVFESLEYLELTYLSSFKSFCSGKHKLIFSSLQILKITGCPRLQNFTSGVVVVPILTVVELENGTKRWKGDLNTTINQLFIEKIAFRSFKHLELSEYPELKELWYRPIGHKPFSNLKSLMVQECNWLSNTLLPLNMLQALSNLEELEVRNCDSLEIVFDLGSMNESEVLVKETIQLKKITIDNLVNLKHIWKQDTLEIVSFDNSRAEHIGDDHQLLKTLEASSVDIQPKDPPTSVEKDGFPNLKQIWSKDSQETLCFYNLQTMQITNCHSLEYLFPFSIAKDLSNLESLQVMSCDGIKEIVSKKDGAIERTVLFELNHLASLDLIHLHQLRGFYAGAHTLKCQSLKAINVFNCKQLKLFDVESNRSQEMALIDQFHFPVLQPLFTLEEVIGNLEKLTLNYADANMILQHQLPWNLFCKLRLLRISQFEDDEAAFPHLFLQNVPNLEILVVEWSSFKEIFNDETLEGEGGGNQSSTRLKAMNLYDLPILQHIFKEGCQIHPVLQVLEILTVKQCSNLRNLVPSSVRFCHLTYLEVENCNGFINLITSLTARSLVKLETMKLKKCNSLEEIVTEEEDDTKSEIAFSNLKILVLECLPSLNSFSSCKCFLKFPLLEKVVVRECPRMEIFSIEEASSPMLRKVLFEEKDEQWCWEGDLSRTINKMFIDKIAFCSFKRLELSEYLELKELWYRPIGHKPFSNLKSLVVQECDWLSNAFLPLNMLQALSNLEELEVRNCDSLEIVFDLGGMNEGEVVVKEIIQLKKITVANLANLKHIWKHDTQETVSFDNSRHELVGDDHQLLKTLGASSVDIQLKDPPTLVEKDGFPNMKQIWSKDSRETFRFYNLQTMQITYCHSLEYLFPFSIAKDLSNVESLQVISCDGLKEIVSKKDGAIERTVLFELNHLASLDLIHLHKLRGFYAGAHTLKCQSLKTINVFNCKQLKLFDVESNRSQEMVLIDQFHFPVLQPLFTLEEVIGNLEKLTLNYADANMILQHQLPWNLFCKLKLLRISQFEDDEAGFPHLFLQNVPNLEILVVEWSSFKEIFNDETLGGEGGGKQSSTRLKVMNLYDLPILQHIFKEGCQIHPVLQVLEILTVKQCSNLRNLVPSSVRFCHLTYLEVENCNGFINLITSLTARSLVKLETMKFKKCNSLKEIVTEEEDDTKSEIAFSSLKILVLECLPSLNSFSSCKCFLKFPLLEKVVVRECPRMEIFSIEEASSPMLRKVLFEEKDEQWCWEGDLSRTINKMFIDKIVFYSFKQLELSEYPELKELWYRPIGHKPFSNLKSLVVQECDWLSNALLPLNMLQALLNLEELEVRNCDSLEAVFDLGGMNESEVDVKETIQLKKIIVENLANLKHIWKQDTQEIVSFDYSRAEHIGDDHKRLKAIEASSVDIQAKNPLPLVEKLKTWNRDPPKILGFHNLQAVTVEDCKDLEYLFPFSTFMDLQFLEQIEVTRCGIKEIVAKEGDMDKTATFVLNHLSSLALKYLHKLERFCPGNYSLTCPSLKILDVVYCKNLELFKTLSVSSQERRVMGDEKFTGVNQSVPQPLFIVEEVIPNLEDLTLDKRYANMIMRTQYSQSQNLFNKLKHLALYDYKDHESTFPYWFLHNIPNLEELSVERSSFEVIFHDKEAEISTQIKYLTLYKLDELQTICQEGSKISPVLEAIEFLDVQECSNLKHLVPSSLTFSHLRELYVEECNGLIYLFTSSTARSLIHLKIMETRKCSSLEQVVAEVRDELGDEIAGSNLKEEITFESLEDLELTCLSSFKSFCLGKQTLVFPSLKNLTITGCPKMKNFSSGVIIAPMLTVVKFENRTKRWKGGLNTTINQLFVDKRQEVVDSDRS